MIVESTLTVGGDLFLMDTEENAPLVEVRFCNEMKSLSDSQKMLIGRAILAALGARSFSEAMGDKLPA